MTEEARADREYADQLGAVLAKRDPEQLRGFLVENARRYGDERQEAEIAGQPPDAVAVLMHRMILARQDLSALHAESSTWLNAHGLESPRPQAKPGLAPSGQRRPRPRKRS